MDNRNERLLAVSGVAAAAAAGLTALLIARTGLLVLRAALPFPVLALALCAAVFLRERLRRREEEEQRDREVARKERPDAALFRGAGEETEPFTAAHSRAIFERYAVPFLSPALALAAGLWAWLNYRRLPLLAARPSQWLLAATFLAVEAFALFVLSRYLLGLGRAAPYRLLRGPGVWLGLGALACAAGGAAGLAGQVGLAAADRAVATGLTALLGVLALEAAVNSVARIYRPPRRGRPDTSYESRVGRLLTDPASWARSIAQTLDYQFGFRVSETWFYRFMEKALLPLLLFQVLTLYALSCFVFVAPEEQAILERFGRPRPGAWLLESGGHLKWPWPFETVRRYPARRVLSLRAGYRDARDTPPPVILWTVPHYDQEDLFLVASRGAPATDPAAPETVPVNLLAMSVPVEYRVTNVYQYAYSFAEPRVVLEQLVYRALTLEAVGRDLFDFMGEGQLDAADALRRRIQRDADALGLGVSVLFVGLQGVHPPVAVADAFESVVGALETREALVLQARAYTNSVLPRAAAEADAVLRRAEAYRHERSVSAEAETQRFLQQMEIDARSPRVFRARAYLDTLVDALANTRKYVLAVDAPHEVIQFDFEQKLQPDLFDFGPAYDTGKGARP